MKNIIKYITLVVIACIYSISCGSFGGITLKNDIKTFQVKRFINKSNTIEAGIDIRFSEGLEDIIFDQSNLDFVTDNGDIIYEGEITHFEITPNNTGNSANSLENRLTITVLLNFLDTKNPEKNFSKNYTAYYNYDNGLTLTEVEEEAYQEIFKNIHQDIVKETISKW